MPKVSELTAGTAPTGAEKIPAVQSGSTVRLTAQQLADLVPTQLSGMINVKDPAYGATGDGSTDDYAAIVAAITAARAANKTLIIPDGTYKHSSSINWAYNNLKVMAPGDAAIFVHSGTGVAHQFSGIANYPATQGCIGGVFGGPGRIMLKGNPAGGTTRVVNVDNWHFGFMKVALRDGATCLYGADTGIVGSSAVCTTFDVRISNNTDGAFTVQPGRGVDFTAPVACIFDKLIVEGCGASSNRAVVFAGAINNTFRGGTLESNSVGGISLSATCIRNTFINLDVESNGTATDWAIAGGYNSFINCQGAGTTAGSTCSGNANVFIGGNWQSMNNTGTGNTFQSNKFATAFTDGGVQTTILNPDGLATAVENATSILGNKTINTDNAITFKIASNTVSAVTGTGATVVLQTAPTITGGLHTALTTLGIRSTGAAFDLTFACTEVLTAGRTLTLKVNDAARTIDLGGNLTLAGAHTLSGAFASTFTMTGTTTVTFPTSGTLATLAGAEALTNKTNVSTAALTVTSAASIGTDGSTATVGPGGTGALDSFLKLFGSDASAQGAKIKLTKNDNTAKSWFFGHVSSVEASGTSSDLEYFNQNTSVRTIRLSIADDSVAFASAIDGTSGTAGAINTLGGIGATKAIWAGNSIKSAGATHGVGYATGAGGAVSQGTNRTTGVTLNTVCGAITLFSQVNTAVSAATAQSFTVTNSAVAATDVIVPSQKSGTDKYEIFITAVAAGSFQITNYSTGGTTNEAPVFNFAVVKAVAA